MIVINLRKQQTLDDHPKAIQQIDITANIDRDENTTMFFIIEEAQRSSFRLFAKNCESIVNLFCFNIMSI